MTDTKQTDEQRARNALADAFGPKGTAAPDKIRAGSKYVTIPVNTAVRAMIAFAAPAVPATNQAGDVERLRVIVGRAYRDCGYDCDADSIIAGERDSYLRELFATQPATSLEGEALAYRYVRGEHAIIESAAYRWSNADGWTETPLFAATPTPPTPRCPCDPDNFANPDEHDLSCAHCVPDSPTPPTLSEDLREAAQAVLDNADRPGARMQFGEHDDVWIHHKEVDQTVLDRLAAALVRAQVKP